MSPDKNQKDNPIQEEYEKKLNPLRSAEKKFSMGGPNSSNTPIKNAEENPDKSWKNNTTGTGGTRGAKNSSSTLGDKWKNNVTGSHTGPQNAKIKYNIRRKGPLTAIILGVVGSGFAISAFLSPSILLVQFKEIMVNKFNTQLSSMDVRTTKMLTNKMRTISGVCSSAVSIRCKYSTMSKKQIERFEKAGIKVKYTEKNLMGRAKPTSFEFNGEKIKPSQFNKKIKESAAFRTAVKRAYNPKFAGFADAIWVKAAAKLGITKAKAKIDGDTDEERLKSMQENTKNPQTGDSTPERVTAGKDTNPETGETYTPEEADEFNRAAREASEAANELAEAAAESATNGVKSAPKVLSSVTAATNAMRLTGWLDNACMAYNTIRAVGFAAKTVRTVQLARYAMIFLNVADQIKAGTADEKDVAYLSKILSTEVAATAASVKLGTATNSFGYRFAAYGEKGKMSDTAMQFMAGGGLTGKLIGVTSLINSTLGGNPRTMCRTLGNPIVAAGSLIAGIGLMLIPGVNAARIAQTAVQAALGASITIALAYLPALLQDIVAGNLIDKSTVGEAAGEALTSGSSGIMSTVANTGGNAPLTPKQAVAYENLTNEIASQYAEEDRLAYSPLDASNTNTFMGKIAARLLPYTTNTSSFSSILGSVASISTGSFSLLTPMTAHAASTDDYTMCQDYDYSDIKGNGSGIRVATDPYCNVTYGIPPEYLNEDPIKIADRLIQSGQIDAETGDPVDGSNYADFVENCINRTRPMGDTGGDGTESDGSECMIKDSNKDYYVHYVDQRVQAGLDGEEVASSAAVIDATSDSSSSGETDPPSGTSQPDNVKKSGNGWTLKDGVDYSNIKCATGTEDGGVYKHPIRKFTIRKCHTSLSSDDGSNEVASLISQKFVDMAQAVKEAGLALKGYGWRSYEEQKSLWDRCAPNCNGMVAQPGNSNHERGLAIDFTRNGYKLTSHDPEHLWLDKHGDEYGFINYSIEPWHWSMDGG